MRMYRTTWIFTALLSLFVLAGCGLSLAEDVTPPPNYRPPTPLPEQPEEVGTAFPLVPPDPQQGEALFAESCEPCHGPAGMGDGSLAENLSNPAPLIGSKELARKARPVDWYHVVTQGRMERQMPPFASLSDRQRWDVVAYTLTLSISPEDRAQGKSLYEETCAGCHGQTGQGDGPQAASLDEVPANWSDQERIAAFSVDDIIEVIADGSDAHPPVAEAWSEDERYAAAAYVRLLSFAGENSPEQAVEPDQAAGEGSTEEDSARPPDESGSVDDTPLENITISGTVTNASEGGSLPEGMQVVISAFAGMTPAFETTGEVSPDGTYKIEDVEYSPEYVYFAQVDSDGVTFNSDILHGSDVTGPEAELPINIYNTSTDTSVLRTDRLHIFFDFSQPGTVQVINLYILSNPSDSVIVPETPDDPVIRYGLPEGAADLQFQDGELGGRYIEVENGFGDRATIPPGQGEHQVLFAYTLPYDRKLDMEIHPPAPVDAAIVMVPPVGVRLRSDQLMDAGQRDVQGMSFQMYQATNALGAGESLNISLSGRAGTGDAAEQNTLGFVIAGAGLFGLVLIGAGVWLYRQRKALQPAVEGVGAVNLPEEPESSEAILDAIVALDDLHTSGKLPEPAYQQRRDDLKQRLAEALSREEGA